MVTKSNPKSEDNIQFTPRTVGGSVVTFAGACMVGHAGARKVLRGRAHPIEAAAGITLVIAGTVLTDNQNMAAPAGVLGAWVGAYLSS